MTALAASASIPRRTSFGWLRSGIVWREFRALGMPLGALCLVQHVLIPLFLGLMGALRHYTLIRPDGGFMSISLSYFLPVSSFIAAVLCGAEEEETGTAIIARLLPITRASILVGKVIGAALAIAAGNAISYALYALILLAAHQQENISFIYPSTLLAVSAFWIGLASGMALRRVLPALIAGGVLAIAHSVIILNYIAANNTYGSIRDSHALLPFASGCVFALIIIAIRLRPELSSASVIHRDIDLRWKEWRTRWPLTVGLIVPVAVVLIATALITYDGFTTLIAAAIALTIAVAIEGGMLWSRQDLDRIGGPLDLLPISSASVVGAKLKSLARRTGLLILAAVFTFLLVVWMTDNSDHSPVRIGDGGINLRFAHLPNLRSIGYSELNFVYMVAFFSVLSLPAVALFAATMALYGRSMIVTFSLSALVLPLLGLLCFSFSTDLVQMAISYKAMWGAYVVIAVKLAALTAGLAWWLYRLYGRTRIHEFGATARLFAGLLYAVVVTEACVVFLLADYRDLLYITLGL